VTRAEVALVWALDALRRGGDLTLDDLVSAYDVSSWDSQRWTLEREHQRLREAAQQLAGFTVADVEAADDEQQTARVVGADGKEWMVTAWATGPPASLERLRVIPAPPRGTVVRDAVEADGPALAELERHAPLRLGEGGAVRVTFDRGDDYFASARLMDDVTIYVAEVDGVVAGVYWGAQQPVLVDGADQRLFLEMHVRIDPEVQRGGVFWALCTYGRERYSRSSDSIAFWVSPENLAVRKFVATVPPWSVQGLRALIPCPSAGADADDVGRRATPDDAAAIAAILDECHRRSELFVPYTPQSLSQRLERDPAQYGWGDVRLGDGAVVAVGRSTIGVVRDDGDSRTTTRRAMVLDHGLQPGAEAEYLCLLRWWAARLGREGATHLAVFTSEGSPTHRPVMELASSVEPFDLWTFEIPEPPGAADHGVYVDPVHF
jgi:hypothetical protein